MTIEAKDVVSVCWFLWVLVVFLRWRRGPYRYYCSTHGEFLSYGLFDDHNCPRCQ